MGEYEKKALARVMNANVIATLYLSIEAKTEDELEARAAELLDLLLYHGRDDGMIGWEANTLPPEKDGDILYTSVEVKTAFRNMADLFFTAAMFSPLISIALDKNVDLQHSEIEEAVMTTQQACAAYKARFNANITERMKRTAMMRNALGIANPKPMVHYERKEEDGTAQ